MTYTPDGDAAAGRANTSRGWRLDEAALERAVTPRARLLILNSPQNPTGKIFTRSELESIARVARQHNLVVIADEVYDSLVYADAGPLVSLASLPGMFERTITVGSVGKTFSVTGWKIGWALGPAPLVNAMWLVSQFVTFCTSTPLSEAVAAMFEHVASTNSRALAQNLALLTGKRDRLVGALVRHGLAPIVPEATYFVLGNTSALPAALPQPVVEGVPRGASASRDYEVCRWLTASVGVTAIPPSAFYSPDHAHLARDLARFCFCKTDDMLDRALERLARLEEHAAAARARG